MDKLKTRSFTVRATDLQAMAWGDAARFGGFRSTSSWLAAAGDYLCRQLARRWKEAEREESGEVGKEPEPELLVWKRGKGSGAATLLPRPPAHGAGDRDPLPKARLPRHGSKASRAGRALAGEGPRRSGLQRAG
jgi:hypothetical protein